MTPDWAALAELISTATPEQIGKALERLDTPTLEWAVRFEAMGEDRKPERAK